MSRLSKTDQIEVDRYVDGEMCAADRAGFESRIQREAVRGGTSLRAAVAAARRLTQLVVDGEPEPRRAPAGFSASVLDELSGLPSREELIRVTDEETIADVVHYARRLLVAALLILGFAALFGLQLFRGVDSHSLDAETLEQKMEQYDEKVRQGKREDALRGRRR